VPALASQAGGVISLACSPDNSQVASISADGSINLWSSDTYQLLLKMEQPKESVNELDSLNFSSDGDQVVLFTPNGLCYIWDANSGDLVKTPTTPGSISLLEDDKIQSFDNHGWSTGKTTGAKAWCYPVGDLKFGTWAYVDGHIIKTDCNGVTTIAEVDQGV
jgi:WD40 repeat protein